MSKKQKFKIEEFLELEAEEGSDNEAHDDFVKKKVKAPRNSEGSEEGNVHEADLSDLVDNSEKVDLEDELARIRARYLEEEIEQDKDKIKRVIRGPVKRKLADREAEDNIEVRKKTVVATLGIKSYNSNTNTQSSENDENPVKPRRKLTNNKFSNKILRNLNENLSTNLDSDEENFNEDLNEILDEYENNLKKEISGLEDRKIKIKERLKENELIMANVINLNQTNTNINKNKSIKPNKFMNLKTITQNNKNSYLNALKNENFFSQQENSTKLTGQNSNFFNDKITEENAKNTKNSKTVKTFHIFNQKIKMDSDKKIQISSIFENGGREKLIQINKHNYK